LGKSQPENHSIHILFNTWANCDNVNAQSLTAREIALRLDPDQFVSWLYLSWDKKPDNRPAKSVECSIHQDTSSFGITDDCS